jgi:hypothetical protein
MSLVIGGMIIGRNNIAAWREKYSIANLSTIAPIWFAWD